MVNTSSGIGDKRVYFKCPFLSPSPISSTPLRSCFDGFPLAISSSSRRRRQIRILYLDSFPKNFIQIHPSKIGHSIAKVYLDTFPGPPPASLGAGIAGRAGDTRCVASLVKNQSSKWASDERVEKCTKNRNDQIEREYNVCKLI